MQTVWKLRHPERLRRDAVLFYCLQPCSSKMLTLPQTPPVWINLLTSEELPSATQKQKSSFYLSVKKQRKGGFLACGLEKHIRVAPCKSHCVSWRPPVLCPPKEHVLAALGLQWKALLEILQPTLTASAFVLTFRPKTFERILKVIFKGCSNLSS